MVHMKIGAIFVISRFKTLIRENESLNDIQKFHYLRMSLKNDAAHAIHSLETSESN